jgi:hypothetical protein
MPGTITDYVIIAVPIVILIAAVLGYLFGLQQAGEPVPDSVPIRLGVFMLGAIAVTCVGGLFYLSNIPDLTTGSDQSSGTAQTPGEAALLQAQGQQGATAAVVDSTNAAVSNAASDAQTLGLSGQIVALLGTIAGASVAGIAGVLVGPGRTERPPPPGTDQTSGRTE